MTTSETMANRIHTMCYVCDKGPLSKNEVGLNKKILETDKKIKRYMCIHCLSSFLECSEEDLIEKIEEFKKEGCKLFS